MAKKVVATLRQGKVSMAKVIKMVKSPKTGAYMFTEQIVTDEQLKEYYKIADTLGLSCLFEAHDEEEVKRCLAAGARILGVNNRNLKNFSVDPLNALSLRDKVPNGILFVSESGISERSQVEALEKAGVNAVLVGETLMRSENKKSCLRQLRGLD